MKYTYLGHNVNYFECNGVKIIVDPWLEGNPIVTKLIPAQEIDYILITHGHFDHIGNTVELALANPKLKIVSNPEVSRYFKSLGIPDDQLLSQYIGGYVDYDGFALKAVLAVHGSSLPDGSYGGLALGFILRMAGKKIYIAGDTGLTVEMQLLKPEKIDLAIMPAGGHYTMDVYDFLKAMDMIEAKQYVPVHYNTFPVINLSAEKLEKVLGVNPAVKILGINESMKI